MIYKTKKLLYPLLVVALVYASCKGQTQKNQQKEAMVTMQEESNDNPKVDINVNKRYDKKGNLISFDSTYTSYYSSRTGDKVLMDSLFREFRKQFPLMIDDHFHSLFFEDSLLYNDFFHEDFFRKRYELNEQYMRRTMQQMDSVKNEFFRIHSRRSNAK